MLDFKSMAYKPFRDEISTRIMHGRNIAKDIAIDNGERKEDNNVQND